MTVFERVIVSDHELSGVAASRHMVDGALEFRPESSWYPWRLAETWRRGQRGTKTKYSANLYLLIPGLASLACDTPNQTPQRLRCGCAKVDQVRPFRKIGRSGFSGADLSSTGII